jgi:hypothetical protein
MGDHAVELLGILIALGQLMFLALQFDRTDIYFGILTSNLQHKTAT